MSVDCQCRRIVTAQFARAIDMLEAQLTEKPDTLRRDANRVFHTAKRIAASDAQESGHNCATSGKCCGGCLATVERIMQDRGYHTGETIDTAPDSGFMEDTCPFPLAPVPAPGG